MPTKDPYKHLTGSVIFVNIFGNGPHSALLQFNVRPAKGEPVSFAVLAYPSTEPQVFIALAGLVTAASISKQDVTVDYEIQADGINRAVGVNIKS